MGKRVLISTIFSAEPVLLATTKLSPEKLILLASKDTHSKCEEAINLIKNSIGKVIDVKTIKIEIYDIVEVAKEVVKIIDLEDINNEIYVNITSGRKTQAIGLLLASYARHDRVKRIAYLTEEDNKTIVYLPKLSFRLTESQRKILEEVSKNKYNSITELAQKINISTAMLYRAIEDLKDMDFISMEEGIKLTDAGKIAML